MFDDDFPNLDPDRVRQLRAANLRLIGRNDQSVAEIEDIRSRLRPGITAADLDALTARLIAVAVEFERSVEEQAPLCRELGLPGAAAESEENGRLVRAAREDLETPAGPIYDNDIQ